MARRKTKKDRIPKETLLLLLLGGAGIAAGAIYLISRQKAQATPTPSKLPPAPAPLPPPPPGSYNASIASTSAPALFSTRPESLIVR